VRLSPVFSLVVTLSVVGVAAGSHLPLPTGRHVVGTTYLVFADESRPELFTEDPDDHREITARAWYPGEPTGGATSAPYYPGAELIVNRFPYPDSLAYIETSAFTDISVSTARMKYPVVIFSHGWGEHVGQSTVLMEELASHGYVVISLAHHYEAKFWIYPDGSLGFLDPASPRFRQIQAEQSQPGMMDLFEAMFKAREPEDQESVFRRSIAAMPTMLMETPKMWAEDIRFVVDQLDSLNDGDGPFRARLDLDRLGVMGMSMGGIAAGEACIGDERIAAGINCDGGLFGSLIDTTLARPFMFMGSRRFVGYDEIFARSVDADTYILIVPESDHYDYTDFTLLHRQHLMIGTVDGRQMLRIVNAYTLAFFDRYLKGEESDILTGATRPFPEVHYTAHLKP
jgi:predicted dienelactone hydrolase